jgi:hypothetical protein
LVNAKCENCERVFGKCSKRSDLPKECSQCEASYRPPVKEVSKRKIPNKYHSLRVQPSRRGIVRRRKSSEEYY